MKYICLIYIIISFVFLAGCAGNKQLTDFVNKDSLENKGLINLALASNGAKVTVSQDNPNHLASTLINGVTSSENWDKGEGWELKCDNVPITNYDQSMQNPLNPNRTPEPDDSLSYGIRVQASNGMSTPLGWVVIEFPEKKTINRMVVHTIDSEKYPANKFGVSYLLLQYWTEASLESEVTGWKVADLIGGAKGKTGNVIRNNKNGVIPIRFQPVKTQRMRLAIWWTNDSKLHSNQYITGAIRLVEVEIYGYEGEKSKNVVSTSANDVAEIEVVLDTYVDGYNKKDVDILMSSISPEYSKDGETYSDLKKRMASMFTEHGQIGLKLQDIKVKLTNTGVIATASYELNIDNSSGIITFNLSKATGFWKITHID
ncbi:MAG: hypothetical protein QG641_2573 [Candidatus Poribacteria bacterium]|nr:hypothetical protein [Candidatus Poribacteria bacterium]